MTSIADTPTSNVGKKNDKADSGMPIEGPLTLTAGKWQEEINNQLMSDF